jgi:predicted unusual protein kinase regulating ubiquinone biosynthesis (AarF/ABC1/UbiB family)
MIATVSFDSSNTADYVTQIASASIGQVYKATLVDGREVAVKVQRPNILSSISLDLYILRLLTPVQVYVNNFFR